MEQMETLGLGQVAEKIEELTQAANASIRLATLPRAALPPGLLVDDPQLLVLTDGKGNIRVESLLPHVANLLGKPARRKGTSTATTLDSFCDLVNRHGDADTAIFVDANWRAPKLTAVLNYHKAVVTDDTSDAVPADRTDDELARFGDHRVVYAFPLSEPWKIWVEKNGKAMDQADFAAFLEDHIHEITMADSDPDGGEVQWEEKFRTKFATPSELMDLARGLEITVGARVKSRQKLQSGESSIVFETSHSGPNGEDLTVPGLFLLHIPVFYRGLPQRVMVRLRYRPAGDKGVVWFYEIFRPDEVVDERVRADVDEVKHLTERPVYDGAPEATA